MRATFRARRTANNSARRDGLRRGAHRLRQRRLAGYLSGERLQRSMPRAGRKPTSYLFHNNRDGTFTDVTRKAGLTHSGWGQGCCVGDYDNDGFDDLFVSYWGRNVLYHNNGDGTFTDVSAKAGVAGTPTRWGAGCCFLDYDRDGLLDLFVANYVNFDPERAPRPGDSLYCRYGEIPGALRTAGIQRRHQPAVPQSRRRHVRRCVGEVGHRQSARHRRRRSCARTGVRRAPTAWAPPRPISTTTAGPTSTSPATRRPACCTTTTTTAHFARSGSPPAAPSMKTAWRSRAWARAWPITTATAGWTSCARTSPTR